MIKRVIIPPLLVLLMLITSASMLRASEEEGFKNLYLKWKTIEGAFGYKIVIVDEKDNVVFEKTLKKNHVNLRLPQGTYRMRLGALNKFNKVETWSDWRNITIKINAKKVE